MRLCLTVIMAASVCAGTMLYAQTTGDLQAELVEVRAALSEATESVANSAQMAELAQLVANTARTYQAALGAQPEIAAIDAKLQELETEMGKLVLQREEAGKRLTQTGGALESVKKARDEAISAQNALLETKEILDLQQSEANLINAIRTAATGK